MGRGARVFQSSSLSGSSNLVTQGIQEGGGGGAREWVELRGGGGGKMEGATFSLTALCSVVMALRRSPVETRPRVCRASSDSSTPSAAQHHHLAFL